MLTIHQVTDLHPWYYQQHVANYQTQPSTATDSSSSILSPSPSTYQLAHTSPPTLEPMITRHDGIKNHQHTQRKQKRWKMRRKKQQERGQTNGNGKSSPSSSPSPSPSPSLTSSTPSLPPPSFTLALPDAHRPSSPHTISSEIDHITQRMSHTLTLHQQERDEIDSLISSLAISSLEDTAVRVNLPNLELAEAELDERILLDKLEKGPEGELFWELLDEACGSLIHQALKVLPLTPAEAAESKTLLYNTSPNKLIVDKFNIEMTGKLLSCLRHGTWLNDEVMNFYLELLNERCQRHIKSTSTSHLTKPYRCHFFNTFFFTKLSDGGKYNYKAVQRWSKKANVNIFDLDLILIPIHVGESHWCLACINFLTRSFIYYDSLGGTYPQCLAFLRRYVQDESRFYLKKECDLSDWEDVMATGIPEQQNGCDCGVFTLKFADYLSHQVPLVFTQRDMPTFRQRIALEIAHQRLTW